MLIKKNAVRSLYPPFFCFFLPHYALSPNLTAAADEASGKPAPSIQLIWTIHPRNDASQNLSLSLASADEDLVYIEGRSESKELYRIRYKCAVPLSALPLVAQTLHELVRLTAAVSPSAVPNQPVIIRDCIFDMVWDQCTDSRRIVFERETAYIRFSTTPGYERQIKWPPNAFGTDWSSTYPISHPIPRRLWKTTSSLRKKERRPLCYSLTLRSGCLEQSM